MYVYILEINVLIIEEIVIFVMESCKKRLKFDSFISVLINWNSNYYVISDK